MSHLGSQPTSIADNGVDADIRSLRIALALFAGRWNMEYSTSQAVHEVAEDLDNTEKRLLLRLADAHESLSPSELAIRLATSLSNVSKAVRRLVDKGYIKREQDQVDLRVYWVSPTEQGLRAIERIEARCDELCAQIVSGWTGAEIRELSRAVVRLNQQLFERAR